MWKMMPESSMIPNDVVIVFMSQNLSSAGSAQNTIATLSRTIYDYYN